MELFNALPNSPTPRYAVVIWQNIAKVIRILNPDGVTPSNGLITNYARQAIGLADEDEEDGAFIPALLEFCNKFGSSSAEDIDPIFNYIVGLATNEEILSEQEIIELRANSLPLLSTFAAYVSDEVKIGICVQFCTNVLENATNSRSLMHCIDALTILISKVPSALAEQAPQLLETVNNFINQENEIYSPALVAPSISLILTIAMTYDVQFDSLRIHQLLTQMFKEQSIIDSQYLPVVSHFIIRCKNTNPEIFQEFALIIASFVLASFPSYIREIEEPIIGEFIEIVGSVLQEEGGEERIRSQLNHSQRLFMRLSTHFAST